MKMCYKCKIEKDLTNFNKRSSSKDGLSPMCKQCMSEYYRSKREKYILLRGENYRRKNHDEIGLSATTKKEWCSYYKIMELKGYDPTGDIHEQFAKKYGLPYKERPPKNRVNHSPQDCGF